MKTITTIVAIVILGSGPAGAGRPGRSIIVYHSILYYSILYYYHMHTYIYIYIHTYNICVYNIISYIILYCSIA